MKLFSFFTSVILFLVILTSSAIAQDVSDITYEDDHEEHLFCDAGIEKIVRGPKNTSLVKSLPSPLNSNSYILCGNGKFRIIFMDIVNATGYGFDDPILGNQRKNCVCEVINYLESVISIPTNIGTSSPTIDIIFNVSQNTNSNLLASAGPVLAPEFYNPSGPFPAPGYYGGYLFDYITTGIKPDINSEEAQVTVNFYHQYAYCSETIADCEYDFYSVILHEITHGLGFITFGQDVSGVLSSKIANKVFSKFDEHFLYYNNGLTKLFDINSTNPSGVNTLPINVATTNRVWLDNSPLVNKQNLPIYSDQPYSPATSLMHLHEAYTLRDRVSPGYSANYVMNGSILKHQKKREFTLQEVKILQTLGYTINPAFIQLSNIDNQTPYHPGLNATSMNTGPGAYFASTPASGLPDLTISTTNDNPVILNLTLGIMTNGVSTQAVNFIDPDGEPITVYEPYPGAKGLQNIRGCGTGNNADQLSINATRDVITFVPRTDFIGRAQFAFHLYDGIQRGDYIIVTVDVTKGITFMNNPPDELVINGSFNQGAQYREIGGNEFNLVVDEVNTDKIYANKIFTDAVQFRNAGHNDAWLINSTKDCLFNDRCFGYCLNVNNPPPANLGRRYMGYSIPSEQFNMQLSEPMIPCGNYTLEFDLQTLWSPLLFIGPNATMDFLFHNMGMNLNIPSNGPANMSLNYPITTTIDSWTHVSIPFVYNSQNASSFFQISGFDAQIYLTIDNVSIKLNSLPPTLSIAPVTATICNGSAVTLTATPSVIGGTYLWSNGETTPSITVLPTSTTTYSCIYAFNGCSSTSVSSTVTVNPIPTITVNNTNICSGLSTTLTATPSAIGGTYLWSNGATTSSITVSPTSTTTYSCVYTLNGCASTAVSGTVTVNPIPTVTVNNTIICSGVTATLTATPSAIGGTYLWSNGATTASITVSPLSTTTYSCVYTLNGCSSISVSGTVTVNPIPTITVNSTNICSGSSSTLTATPSAIGGTYLWNNGATTASITVSPLSTTTYSCVYILNGCPSTSVPGTVTVNPIPTVTVNNTTICSGATATLTATPSAIGGTYLWSNGATTASITVSPTTTTTYSCVYTLNGCSSISVSGTVTVNLIPTITVNNSTICSGSSTTLTGTPSAIGGTYLWNNGATTASITVSPLSTTTYSCVYTLNGCSSISVSGTVTVNPIPTITVNSTTICSGLSTTLTAIPSAIGGTYLWSNGATTASITVSPTTTTTYSCIYTLNGCSSTSVSGTVTVTPTPTISVNNTIICNGSTATLTASPTVLGGTYLWSNGETTASITISPTSTTTYSCVYTLNGCASTSVSGTVIVNPIPTIIVNSTTIFSGSSTTLTAIPSPIGGTYLWSNGATTPSITISPTSTTTYSCVYTLNGCSSTSASGTVTVNPSPCGNCPNVLAQNGILSSNPAPNQVYCVNNDITVNGNITISRSELKILTNITITISAGSTLNIIGSHLYACSDMWKGIVVQPGGRISVTTFVGTQSTTRSSLIEDAIIGIDVLSNNGLTTNVLNVNNATFNRNLIGIRVKDYKLALANYPFTIVNSVFTSRNIPFTTNSLNWPQTSSIKGANNPTTGPLQTPYIHNITYPQKGTNAFLRAPYLGQKPQAGVYLSEVGNIVNTVPTAPVYYEMMIGTAGAQSYNVFDNLIVGIDGYNTNLKVVNSIFQNTMTSSGVGIQGTAILKSLNRLQVVGANPAGNFANKFYNCSKAIYTQGYYEHTIRKNDFRSTQSSQQMALTNPGKYGVYIKTNQYRKIDVSLNLMSNLENGIAFTSNYTGPQVVPGQYSGQIDITQNTIQRYYSGIPGAFQYVSNAISVSNVLFTGSSMIIAGTTVNINNNTIVGAYRGISTTNWQNKNVNVSYNTVSLVLDGNPGNPMQYGISHTNNIPLVQNFTDHNTISGYNTTNSKLYGIYVSLSNRQYVSCNTTSNTYHGIAFAGNCSSTQTRHNSMSNHHYGFVLDNNGVIGLQGTATAPCDNQYLGTWPSGTFKTATLNGSSSQNSKMYVHSIGSTNPNGFGTSSTGPLNLYSSGNGSLLYVSGNANNIDCSEIFGINPINPSEKQDLEKIVQNQMNEVMNPFETQKINKHQVYRLLKANPDAMLESSVLQVFYTSNQPTVNEKLVSIETDFSQGDAVLGAAKVADLLPLDNIESNYKLFYELYNKSFGDTITDTLTPTDSLNLMTLASACPFIDGAIVYQARAMYNTIYSTALIFEEYCDGSGGGKSMMLPNQNSKEITNLIGFDVLMYPNPSTGNVSIIPIGIKEGDLDLIIRDVTGKVIHQSNLSVTNSYSNFNFDSEDGTYFVTFINLQTNEKTIKKLTLQK